MMSQELFDFTHPSQLGPIRLHGHPYKNSTSEAAWESVKACNWASRAAKQAYRILYESGPLTILELEHAAAREDGRVPKGRSESTVVRRLFDLRNNELAELTGQIRMCTVRKKPLVTWMVTTKLAPSEKAKKVKHCPHCGKEI